MNRNTPSILVVALLSLMAVSLTVGPMPLYSAIKVVDCGCGLRTCQGCSLGSLRKRRNQAPQPLIQETSCGCSTCAQQGNATSQHLVQSPTMASSCNSCQSCTIQQPRQISCPQCDCDFCELKTESIKEKKKCYKVEQKEVCVKPVRFPWQKNCPPKRAKVRVVNVLKSDTYECPACKYTWSVYEPEVPKVAQPASAAETPATNKDASESGIVIEQAPEPPAKTPEAFDLKDVPRPPIEGK